MIRHTLVAPELSSLTCVVLIRSNISHPYQNLLVTDDDNGGPSRKFGTPSVERDGTMSSNSEAENVNLVAADGKEQEQDSNTV